MDFLTEPQIVGVICGESSARAEIKSRASHTLIFKESGESLYHLRGQTVHFVQNTVLFIPEGESYRFEKATDGKSIYHLINFHASLSEPLPPRLFTVRDAEKVAALFAKMEKKQLFAAESTQKYELLSHFYQLLALLAGGRQGGYIPTEQKDKIAPAIDYLADHLFDADVKITALHTLCGMSAPTFRRIFVASFGASPRKYLTDRRMKQAKAMLESGESKSIGAVAAAVGISDPLYFSRLFRAYFQMPPSKFKNKK